MYYHLTDHFQVAADLQQCWEFFGRAENLPDITPGWLRFTLRTPSPIVIAQDSILDYTIYWAKLPVRWRTKIIEWSPPHHFIDLQIKGPYTLWHHQHRFTPVPDGRGTVCQDNVIYKVPGGILGRALHALTIRKQLIEIFKFRRKVIGERLGWMKSLQNDVQIRTL